MGFFRGKLTTFLILFEILFIVLFAVFVRYDDVASPGATGKEGYYSVDRYYACKSKLDQYFISKWLRSSKNK